MACAETMLFRGIFFDHKGFQQLIGIEYENNQPLIVNLREILGEDSGLIYCRTIDDRYCSLDYIHFFLSSYCIYFRSNPDIVDKEDLLHLYSEELKNEDAILLNYRSNIIDKICNYTNKSFEECEKLFEDKIEIRSLIYDFDHGAYSLDR